MLTRIEISINGFPYDNPALYVHFFEEIKSKLC